MSARVDVQRAAHTTETVSEISREYSVRLVGFAGVPQSVLNMVPASPAQTGPQRSRCPRAP